MGRLEYISRKFVGKWRLFSVLSSGWLTTVIKVVSAEPYMSLSCRCAVGFYPVIYHPRMESDGILQL